MNWNVAAAAVVNFIFSQNTGKANLEDVRRHLDIMIKNHWLQDGDPTSDWIILGALGLAAGRNVAVFPESDFSEQVAATLVRKQTDYGSENISRFGNNGIMVRMHDKVARLENLTNRGALPENESLFDNYLDLLGYATIGVMWAEGTFLIPLQAYAVVESPQS